MIIYDKDSVNIKVGARRAVKFSDADQPALHRSLKVCGWKCLMFVRNSEKDAGKGLVSIPRFWVRSGSIFFTLKLFAGFTWMGFLEIAFHRNVVYFWGRDELIL